MRLAVLAGPKEGTKEKPEQNVSPYCPTVGITIIDLLHDLRVGCS